MSRHITGLKLEDEIKSSTRISLQNTRSIIAYINFSVRSQYRDTTFTYTSAWGPDISTLKFEGK